MFKQLITIWLLASITTVAGTHAYSHAPIGVMGDHVHKKGELMFSYRAMHMSMTDTLSGSDDISQQELFDQSFMVAPNKMTMTMHMFGMMLAPSDQTTLMIMVPYIQNKMTLTHKMQGEFETKTDGLGDIKISALHVLKKDHANTLHIINGLSIPTGEINKRGAIPGNSDVQLPYPMQLGSGSLDYLLGINWFGMRDNGSWGTQIQSTIRTDTNNREYRLGNVYEATAWIAQTLSDSLSGSLRLTAKTQDDISGEDSEIAMMSGMNPLATSEKGYTRATIGLGLNWVGQSGRLKDHRLALEWIIPVYQDVNGIQMKTDPTITLGWQYAFK